MLDLNHLRDAYAQYLHDNRGQRHSMDGALMHVCRIAYDAGLADASTATVGNETSTMDPEAIVVVLDGERLPITAAGTDFRAWRRDNLERLATELTAWLVKSGAPCHAER